MGMRDGKRKEGIEKGVAGDDVRVSDKSLSSFTVAFSISGSLRRSPKLERERGREEDSKRNRCKVLTKEKKRRNNS